MIEQLLDGFATAMTTPLGLTPEKALPEYGVKIAARPSAKLAINEFGPATESGVSRGEQCGRTLPATLYIYLSNYIELLRHLDKLDTIYKSVTSFQVGSVEVWIQWGRASVPLPDPEQDPSTYYQIQQSLTFEWG